MKKTSSIILGICFLFAIQLLANANLPKGYNYIFPQNGSKYVHPTSTIILRFENNTPNELINLGSVIKVKGEKSGQHLGKTIIASDNLTIIFKSEKIYELGETVNVTINPLFTENSGKGIEPLNYEFTVLEEIESKIISPDVEDSNLPLQKKNMADNQAMIMPNGVSVPSDFPHVNITVNNNPSSDYIFLNNSGTPNYNIIFNTSGEPVWYWKTPDSRRDFKVQSNGQITMLIRDGYGGTGEGHIVLTENFEFVKSMRATNGYTTDEHELFMLPDSGYFLIGRRETQVDMSQYVPGGQPNATVRETCIQEFTANDEMIFIWKAWDHFDIRDLEIENLYNSYIRFPHMNAIFVDEDEHILLSSRHLSEISKIDRESGEFIWRMIGTPGSLNNDFKFVNDPLNGFRNQHAIRSLGNNRYTLFDNGNNHSPPVSRGVEYQLDTTNMIATLVLDHRTGSINTFSHYMGNVQRLPNGNTHINWAVGHTLPIAQEVTPEGTKVFEMRFKNGHHCYRSFRHPWEGVVAEPYLMLEPQVDNLTLIFNKFGDDNIKYYKIYGDRIPNPTTLIDTSRATLKSLTNLINGARYYFRVTAVDNNDNESAYSNEEDIIVNIVQPGTNLIVNGDFANNLDAWTWEVSGSASADIETTDGICHFLIQNGGTEIYNVQLRQNGIPLLQGENYTFEFDAWADASRAVEIKVGQDVSPYTNYSRIGYSAFSTTHKRFSYSFIMQESSDNSARVVVNAGTDVQDIYIDNLSLKMDVPSNIENEIKTISQFSLNQNYPNPFNPTTSISYSLPKSGLVQLKIYDMLGREVAALVNKVQSTGNYKVEFNSSSVNRRITSGIYFYRLQSGEFVETKKLILLR